MLGFRVYPGSSFAATGTIATFSSSSIHHMAPSSQANMAQFGTLGSPSRNPCPCRSQSPSLNMPHNVPRTPPPPSSPPASAAPSPPAAPSSHLNPSCESPQLLPPAAPESVGLPPPGKASPPRSCSRPTCVTLVHDV